MAFEVFDCLPEPHGVIVHETYGCVAGLAEEASHFSGVVIMVHGQPSVAR